MRTTLLIGTVILVMVSLWFVDAMITSPEAIPSPAIKTISSTAVVGMTMSKVEWDGHLWAILDGESLCHHPGCQCLKKEFEEPEVLEGR